MYIYVIIQYCQDGPYGDTWTHVVYAGTDAETGYREGMKFIGSTYTVYVDCEVWLDGEHKFDVEVKSC